MGTLEAIETVATFSKSGVATPLEFKVVKDDTEFEPVRIARVVERKEEKFAVGRILVYRCESRSQGIVKAFLLKYEVATCKWYLCQ